MNEYLMIALAVLHTIVVALVAALYAIGGRSNKWVRRFVAPALLVGYCAYLSKNWPVALISYPLYAAAYSLGYGVNSKLNKWLSSELLVRTITASAYVFACIGIIAAVHAWSFLVLAICITAILTTVAVTTIHRFPAAVEEYFAAFTTAFFVPFLAFITRAALVIVILFSCGLAQAGQETDPAFGNCQSYQDCMKQSTQAGDIVMRQLSVLKAIAFTLHEDCNSVEVRAIRGNDRITKFYQCTKENPCYYAG